MEITDEFDGEELLSQALDGPLSYNGKPVVLDRYSLEKVTLEERSDGSHAFVSWGKKQLPVGELDLVHPAPDAWALYRGVLRLVDEADCERLAQSFVPKEVKEVITPRFELSDGTGAFGNLTRGEEWESDLLEAGFIRKPVGETDYYCPTDRAAAALQLLIECGWEVVDKKGRQVVPIVGLEIQTLPGMRVKAELQTADESFDLTQMQEFAPQLLMGIDQHRVGLLTHPSYPEKIGELLGQAELDGPEIRLKPKRLAGLSWMEGPSIWETLQESLEGEPTQVQPGAEFQAALRPYQQEGLNWLAFLHRQGFHGLLADEMGLGKTVQLLAFLSQLDHAEPTLIAMPRTLLFNWANEIAQFLPGVAVSLYHGKERTLASEGIILTSYGTLRKDVEILSQRSYQCVVLDEAQAIKNQRSQTHQAARRLQGSFRISLSGTPMENSVSELVAQYEFLMPDLLSDTLDPALIKRRVRPFLLRRTKEGVQLQLPPRIEQRVTVAMEEEQREVYLEALARARGKPTEVLPAITQLRQICGHPLLVDPAYQGKSGKFRLVLEDLQTIVAEGHKVLVVSQFTSMLHLLGKEFDGASLYLEGKTVDREAVVEKFQQDPGYPALFLSLKAGGVGLNLTAADYVLIVDPWWNEAAEEQAIARAHRIGQQGAVIVKRYICQDSIEEKMLDLKGLKEDQIRDLMFPDP